MSGWKHRNGRDTWRSRHTGSGAAEAFQVQAHGKSQRRGENSQPGPQSFPAVQHRRRGRSRTRHRLLAQLPQVDEHVIDVLVALFGFFR